MLYFLYCYCCFYFFTLIIESTLSCLFAQSVLRRSIYCFIKTQVLNVQLRIYLEWFCLIPKLNSRIFRNWPASTNSAFCDIVINNNTSIYLKWTIWNTKLVFFQPCILYFNLNCVKTTTTNIKQSFLKKLVH